MKLLMTRIKMVKMKRSKPKIRHKRTIRNRPTLLMMVPKKQVLRLVVY